jgi:hypothetical protein
MKARHLFDRLVGARPNWKWWAWPVVAWIAGTTAQDCWSECGVTEFALMLGIKLGVLALMVVLFLAFNGGIPALRAYLAVRRFRSVLDPIAATLGASVSTRWSDRDPVCSVFYSLSDHFYIVVLVGPGGGFNPHRHADEENGGPAPKELEVLHAAASRACN